MPVLEFPSLAVLKEFQRTSPLRASEEDRPPSPLDGIGGVHDLPPRPAPARC